MWLEDGIANQHTGIISLRSGWINLQDNKIVSGESEIAMTSIKESGSFVEKAITGNELFFPDWISGSVVMMKKDIYGQLNGFDEDFWMYYEDVDICKRAQDAGGRIVFCKNITIEHNHGGSSRMNLRITSLTKTEVYISRHVYISKHKRGIERGLIQTFLVVNSLIS